jgi:serine/threonine-protein kinase RsbW
LAKPGLIAHSEGCYDAAAVKASTRVAHRNVAVPATDAGLRRAAEAFEAFTAGRDIPVSGRNRFLLALDEILSNIIRHGSPQPLARISLTFSIDRDVVSIQCIDSADPFNPLDAPAPDTTATLDARQPGGLGIALVRAMMDDVRYERRDGHNVLTLVARIPAPAAGDGDAH